MTNSLMTNSPPMTNSLTKDEVIEEVLWSTGGFDLQIMAMVRVRVRVRARAPLALTCK